MRLNVLRVIPGNECSDGKTCPAKAATDRGSYVIVGKTVTDPEALSALGIGADETAVEVPAALLDEE